MQHAGKAVAARCSGCCTALCRRGEQFRYSLPRISTFASTDSGIRSHQFGFSLPSNQVFVPTDSDSCFHGCCRSFLWTQSPASIKSGIRPHRFKFLFPRILSFLSTNSDSCFHRFCRSFPRIQTPAFTNSTPHSHEFQYSLPPIQTFLLTNVGKQKRHPFVGMSFSIAFPLSGGAWRIRTAVDGFADR